MIDLRSDTVTRPTAPMREAMARAPLGDDVLGDDPSAHALEEEIAHIVGRPAALFVPSGTMGNQLAIATQTRPGDDVIVGAGAHCMLSEAGAAAALSGVQFSIAGRGGTFTADEMDEAVQPRAFYTPHTSLVALENTHNRAGGLVWSLAQTLAVADRARERGLRLHLDGARVWNASVARGVDVATLCAPFDTVSVCFSKGLGAPVGSALCASREIVERSRRLRRQWGGAMRQVGGLAAAAMYALAHHRARLAEDHENARALAERLAGAPGVRVDGASVETNIVNIDLDVPAEAVSQAARNAGVLILATGTKRLRAVTHLDVSRADVLTAAGVLAEAVAAATSERR